MHSVLPHGKILKLKGVFEERIQAAPLYIVQQIRIAFHIKHGKFIGIKAVKQAGFQSASMYIVLHLYIL